MVSAFFVLALAQNGYDYNRPGQSFSAGKPFTAASTPGRPGSLATTSNGYPAPTSPSFTSQGTDEYPTTGTGTNGLTSGPQSQGLPTGQNQGGFPTGQTQGYPSGPNQGSGFQPGQNQNYPGAGNQPNQQGFPGQTPSGINSGFPGQSTNGQQTFPVDGQNYPGQAGADGNGPTGFGGSGGSAPGAVDSGAYEGGDYSAIPGEPDRDYPIYSEIPQTSFRCDAQQYPGYYADVEARCQVFHICANNQTYDFLCPNGTVFSQEVFVCVWWNQFDCNSAPEFYGLNANIYDYSINRAQNQNSGSGFQQGPSGFGGDTTGQAGFPGASGVQATSYSDNTAAQGPTSSFPGATGSEPQGFTGGVGSQGYPTSPGPNYPTSNGATNFPGNSQGSTFAGTGSDSGYPDGGNSQPTAFPGGQSTGFPGSQTTGFPGSQGSQGAGFAGSRPSGSQGYPSGRPNGPSFSSGRPGQGQGGSNFVSPPNREYLPPKN